MPSAAEKQQKALKNKRIVLSEAGKSP